MNFLLSFSQQQRWKWFLWNYEWLSFSALVLASSFIKLLVSHCFWWGFQEVHLSSIYIHALVNIFQSALVCRCSSHLSLREIITPTWSCLFLIHSLVWGFFVFKSKWWCWGCWKLVLNSGDDDRMLVSEHLN